MNQEIHKFVDDKGFFSAYILEPCDTENWLWLLECYFDGKYFYRYIEKESVALDLWKSVIYHVNQGNYTYVLQGICRLYNQEGTPKE